MKKAPTLLAVAVALMVGGTTKGQTSPQLQCNTQGIDQALVDNDPDSALKLTEACVVKNLADLEADGQKYRGKPVNFIDVVRLDELNAGASLIAKVEILTLRGALTEAESALAEAERFDHQHPGAGMSATLAGSPLAIARAFVLERKGDLKAAAAVYEGILAAEKRDGWPDNSSVIRGRLAIVSLMRGDEPAAERWSADSLLADPGANAARGALLQRKGNTQSAKQYYAAALKLMDDAAKRKNWTLPIYFAELRRAKDGLNK